MIILTDTCIEQKNSTERDIYSFSAADLDL